MDYFLLKMLAHLFRSSVAVISLQSSHITAFHAFVLRVRKQIREAGIQDMMASNNICFPWDSAVTFRDSAWSGRGLVSKQPANEIDMIGKIDLSKFTLS